MRKTTATGLWHRITALALSVLMVLTLLPATAMADAAGITPPPYKLTYRTLDDGTAEITGLSGERKGDLIIPAVIDGKTVTSIGDYAFKDPWHSAEIHFTGSIKIADGIKRIGKGAFSYNWDVSGEIYIPDSVETIGEAAFQYCGSNSYLTLHLPKSLRRIESHTFDQVGAYQVLQLPDNVEYIGKRAFGVTKIYGQLKLPSTLRVIDAAAFSGTEISGELVIPDGVTTIGDGAFNGTKITGRLVIPDSVKTIGPSAFQDNEDLGAVVLPDGLQALGENAFRGCIKLSGPLHIPAGLTRLNNGVFYDCKRLTGQLTIPSNITEIGADAFGGCKGFTGNLVIPETVRRIEDSAFAYCSGLDGTLTLPGHMDHLGESVFSQCPLTGTVTLPDGLSEVPSSLFQGCDLLTAVKIPDGVRTIGSYAFDYCKCLEKINLPDSITEIQSYAFNECDNLPDLRLPLQLKTIGESAFHRTKSMFEVTLPPQLDSIGDYAFASSNVLKLHFQGPKPAFGRDVLGYINHEVQIDYNRNDPTWSTAEKPNLGASTVLWNGMDLGPACQDPSRPYPTASYLLRYEPLSDGTVEITGYDGTPSGKLVLPQTIYGKTVTRIGDKAFYECTALTGEVKIPSTVTHIGVSAFQGCTQLTGKLVVPETVTSLGENAFYDTGITALEIRSGITLLDRCVFQNCSALRTVTIGDSVEKVGIQAFCGCTALETVRFGRGLQVLSNAALAECTNLQTVTFTGHAPEIDIAAFEGSSATARYPENDPTWANFDFWGYGGHLYWQPYGEKPQTLPAPQLTVTNNASTGKPYLDWSTVDGAEDYEVYFSTSRDGSYSRLYRNPNPGVRHGSATAGITYYYKVRAIAGNTKSSWSTIETRTCDLARPNVKASTNADGKPVLTWQAIPGAESYLIYCRTDGSDFQRLASVHGTTLRHGSALAGRSYTYKVRAIASRSAANSAWSYYDTIHVDGLATPTFTVTNTASTGKPYLQWSPVDGAAEYTIYYSTSKNGPYKWLYTTSGTTLKHGSAKVGVTYYYKIRAIAADGARGKLSTYKIRTCDLARPNVILSLRDGHPYLGWKAIPGAVKYDVYCSRDGGSFIRLLSVKSNHLNHGSAKRGHTYRYRVKAIANKSSANSAYSYYDTITLK